MKSQNTALLMLCSLPSNKDVMFIYIIEDFCLPVWFVTGSVYLKE